MLDAVRAAHKLPGVRLGDRLVAEGADQGGQAALFSAQIAGSYAPELHLLGVAAGSPAADLPALERAVTTTPYGVEFLLEAAAGYSAAHPTAKLGSILTPLGLADLQRLHTECDDQFGSDTAGQSIQAVFRSDPRTTPPLSAGLAANSAGTVRTAVPILITQATHDVHGGAAQLYPAPVTTGFVRRICQLGDTVDYRLFDKLPHDGPAGATAADPVTVRWITDRFAGVPPRPPAPTSADQAASFDNGWTVRCCLRW